MLSKTILRPIKQPQQSIALTLALQRQISKQLIISVVRTLLYQLKIKKLQYSFLSRELQIEKDKRLTSTLLLRHSILRLISFQLRRARQVTYYLKSILPTFSRSSKSIEHSLIVVVEQLYTIVQFPYKYSITLIINYFTLVEQYRLDVL